MQVGVWSVQMFVVRLKRSDFIGKCCVKMLIDVDVFVQIWKCLSPELNLHLSSVVKFSTGELLIREARRHRFSVDIWREHKSLPDFCALLRLWKPHLLDDVCLQPARKQIFFFE